MTEEELHQIPGSTGVSEAAKQAINALLDVIEKEGGFRKGMGRTAAYWKLIYDVRDIVQWPEEN